MLILKLGDNLHVTETGLIVSYHTTIGSVTPNHVETFGSFSRASTKHISKICSLTSLPRCTIHTSNPSFHKFEKGVKCKPFSNKPLSQDFSKTLIKFLPQNLIQGIMAQIIERERISKTDQMIIKDYLASKKIGESVINGLMQIAPSLMRM